MPLTLSVRYRSAADLARHLRDHASQGAMLLRPRQLPAEVQQFQTLTLLLSLPEEEAELEAEVIQVIPNLGLVVRLREPELAEPLAGETPPGSPAEPPEVEVVLAQAGGEAAPADPELLGAGDEAGPGGQAIPRGMGPISWPFEKLQAEWAALSLADRVRVAKYGKRPARGLIIRLNDPTLHNVLLSNPQISVEEVAALAGQASLDSSVLKRIAGSADWTRHTAVARNLVCHPKCTLPQITKLIEHLSDNELRQLTRAGKVRASVKRIIIKKIEQRAGRR